MMAVQTAWIYIHIHTETKGATLISDHLQESTCAAPYSDPDLWQMEKTNGAGVREGNYFHYEPQRSCSRELD